MSEKIGVVFVCLGNICRSPLAECVFREVVTRAGLEDRFEIDSAGTSDYHIGESPDERSVAVAATRGLELQHRARQFTAADLARFDYVLAMDAANLGRIRRLANENPGGAEVDLFRRFDEESMDDLEVPDPYFGGVDGFEHVQDIIERSAEGLLEYIRTERGL